MAGERDPAVVMWREAFAAADRSALAVAADARCLLLALAGMPPSERGAFAEELAAAEPGDVPGLLRAWRVIAGLHASLGTVPGPQNGSEAHSGPQSPAGGSALTGGGERTRSPLAATQSALPAVETPSRQVPARPEDLPATSSHHFGRISVSHPLDDTEPAALPRRFATLSPAQLTLAQELTRRADRLWRDAGGELSLAEAVTIAAVQMGHYTDATDGAR